MKVGCWLKIEPAFSYSHRQLGWKIVGVTQSQPKRGHAIHIQLDIPRPQMHEVEVQPDDIIVQTQTDQRVQRIVEELGGEEV